MHSQFPELKLNGQCIYEATSTLFESLQNKTNINENNMVLSKYMLDIYNVLLSDIEKSIANKTEFDINQHLQANQALIKCSQKGKQEPMNNLISSFIRMSKNLMFANDGVKDTHRNKCLQSLIFIKFLEDFKVYLDECGKLDKPKWATINKCIQVLTQYYITGLYKDKALRLQERLELERQSQGQRQSQGVISRIQKLKNLLKNCIHWVLVKIKLRSPNIDDQAEINNTKQKLKDTKQKLKDYLLNRVQANGEVYTDALIQTHSQNGKIVDNKDGTYNFHLYNTGEGSAEYKLLRIKDMGNGGGMPIEKVYADKFITFPKNKLGTIIDMIVNSKNLNEYDIKPYAQAVGAEIQINKNFEDSRQHGGNCSVKSQKSVVNKYLQEAELYEDFRALLFNQEGKNILKVYGIIGLHEITQNAKAVDEKYEKMEDNILNGIDFDNIDEDMEGQLDDQSIPKQAKVGQMPQFKNRHHIKLH
jgi:hypothetical protein